MFSLLGRTFASVFPNAAMVKVGPVDYLLIGYGDDRKNHDNFDWSVARANYQFARQSTNVTLPNSEFLVHLILTEDLPGLFGQGALHTDNYPYLEYLAPMLLNGTTLNIDELVHPHRWLHPTTKRFLAAHNTIDSYLDLMEFSASAGVPIFNLLTLDQLDKPQQDRYQDIVTEYCGRLLLPSYSLISDPQLRLSCAGSQATAIGKKIESGKGTVVDRYNLALANIATGNRQEATAELERILTIDADNEAALYTLGLLLAQDGRIARVEKILTRLALISPEKSNVIKSLSNL